MLVGSLFHLFYYYLPLSLFLSVFFSLILSSLSLRIDIFMISLYSTYYLLLPFTLIRRFSGYVPYLYLYFLMSICPLSFLLYTYTLIVTLCFGYLEQFIFRLLFLRVVEGERTAQSLDPEFLALQ